MMVFQNRLLRCVTSVTLQYIQSSYLREDVLVKVADVEVKGNWFKMLLQMQTPRTARGMHLWSITERHLKDDISIVKYLSCKGNVFLCFYGLNF